MRYRYCAFVVGLIFTLDLSGQTLVVPSSRWTTKPWDAHWITGDSRTGVFHFRKSFTLSEKPHQFIVHLSADNRYKLYVNGKFVNDGPQLSDLRHWRFESLDIADLLQPGNNVIAVEVWNQGDEAAVYMMGKRLALIMQGDDQASSVVNTDK